jgi:exodeoxyribonuclease VII small subunit
MVDNLESLSFEQAMTELEILVKRLEEGRLPLEEAISAFERGALLKKHCEQKLLAAKMRVEQITGMTESGARLEDFNVT